MAPRDCSKDGCERQAVTETLLKGIKEETTKIWKKLEKQGDVRKDFDEHKNPEIHNKPIDDHIKSHWKFIGLISLVLAVFGIVFGIIKYYKG